MSASKHDDFHDILNHLNDKNKVVAKSFLSWLLEKQADEEDEYLTSDDLKALEKGRIQYQNGQTKSLEDLKREFEI